MDKAQWKVVPVEPTPEMMQAADDRVGMHQHEESRAAYAAMIAAAPQPPSASGELRTEQLENAAFTAWWYANQECPEHSLITQNAAHAAWQARAALAPSPGIDAAEPVGEVILFANDRDLKEVAWKRGKMPPVGTKLFAAPPAAQPSAEWLAQAERLVAAYGRAAGEWAAGSGAPNIAIHYQAQLLAHLKARP